MNDNRYLYNFLEIDTFPYDDTGNNPKAKFNYEEERYEIQLSYIESKIYEFNDEFENDREKQFWINEWHDQYYDLIYSTCNNDNKENNIKVRKYIMAKDHNVRNNIIRGFISFVKACITTQIDRNGEEKGYKRLDDLPLQTKRILDQVYLLDEAVYMFTVKDNQFKEV